jgi:hypothetical protein
MALNEIVPVTKPPKKGGGVLGSVVGGIVGALAAIGTTIATWNPGAGAGAGLAAGAAAAGSIAGGAGAGMGLGGMIGEAANPSKAGEVSEVIPKQQNTSKPMQTVAMNNPEVQLATMQHSKNLLKNSSQPDALQYMDLLNQASGKLKNQLGVG